MTMTDADAQTLREIADRVEKLSGPDREVDEAIHAAIGLPPPQIVHSTTMDGVQTGLVVSGCLPKRYTASADAALTLVPAGLSLGFTVPYQRDAIVSVFWPRPRAELWKPLGQAVGRGEAATTPLALTAAALRALAVSQEQRHV